MHLFQIMNIFRWFTTLSLQTHTNVPFYLLLFICFPCFSLFSFYLLLFFTFRRALLHRYSAQMPTVTLCISVDLFFRLASELSMGFTGIVRLRLLWRKVRTLVFHYLSRTWKMRQSNWIWSLWHIKLAKKFSTTCFFYCLESLAPQRRRIFAWK